MEEAEEEDEAGEGAVGVESQGGGAMQAQEGVGDNLEQRGIEKKRRSQKMEREIRQTITKSLSLEKTKEKSFLSN